MIRKKVSVLGVGIIIAGILAAPDAHALTAQKCNPAIKRGMAADGVRELQQEMQQIKAGLPKPESIEESGCLGDIFDQGFEASFNIPSFGDIVDQIRDQACDRLENEIDSRTAGIKEMLNNKVQGSVNADQLFPGLDLGTYQGGISVGVDEGQQELFETNAAKEYNEAAEDVMSNTETASDIATPSETERRDTGVPKELFR